MAKKTKPASKAPPVSPAITVDIFGDETEALTLAFIGSTRAFLDRVLMLRDELGEQFEHDDYCRSWFWNPPSSFDCGTFYVSARRTYEAWRAAKKSNAELEDFDGETIKDLAWSFHQLERGIDATSGLHFECETFKLEVSRLNLKNLPLPEVGPFKPKWLREMFCVEDNRTLKDRLNNCQRVVTQNQWYLPGEFLAKLGDWQQLLRNHIDGGALENEDAEIEVFLSLH